MSSIEQLEASIAKQTQQLADLKLALKEAKEQSPDKLLAVSLHSLLCNCNHIDQCGWDYEFKDKNPLWDAHSHGKYLKKAQKLICHCKEIGVDINGAIEIVKLVNSL